MYTYIQHTPHTCDPHPPQMGQCCRWTIPLPVQYATRSFDFVCLNILTFSTLHMN